MKIIAETERLILRELVVEDETAMFELDSDPEVHRYVGNSPVESIEQIQDIIEFIQKQYEENGVGRWAVIEKSSNKFIGWAGLKLFKNEMNNHSNFYELGYRLIKSYWGKGYATEAALASVKYGIEKLGLKEIYAMTDVENINSKKVLEKAGFKYIETFDDNGDQTDWFKLSN
jgi:ribosomal-protein-alanine N-acetyltransferase